MSSAAAGRRRRGRRPPGSAPQLKLYLRTGAIEEIDAAAGYDGIAFGAEFCARRLPPVAAAERVLAHCAATGVGFTFVTPLLQERDFDPTADTLQQLAGLAPGTECVVNDWGLLHWLAENAVEVTPVAGRLLSRQRRGPRVLQTLSSASPTEVRALRGSIWDDAGNIDLLLEAGVRRVELDFLLQGTGRPNLPPEIALSVCAPWLPVTLSPACPWTADPTACARDCLQHPAAQQQCAEDPHPLWSRGNALFVRSDVHAPYRSLAQLGADRLVWTEQLVG